jgi:hypothetical protein
MNRYSVTVDNRHEKPICRWRRFVELQTVLPSLGKIFGRERRVLGEVWGIVLINLEGIVLREPTRLEQSLARSPECRSYSPGCDGAHLAIGVLRVHHPVLKHCCEMSD